MRNLMNDKPIEIGDCKACRGKVSSEAAACPHCGQPAPFKQQCSETLDHQDRSKGRIKPNIPANANTQEVWIPVDGYDGYFSVSSFGNIRSEDRTIPHKRFGTANHKGKTMIPTQTKGESNRYGVVSFSKEGKGKTFLVHQLVAINFLENPNGYSSVNHIDGNGLNNRLDNLEWVSAKNNAIHAYKFGLAKARRGETNSCAKLTNENVREIRKLISERTLSQRKIAKMFNVVPMVISDIKSGKTWRYVV